MVQFTRIDDIAYFGAGVPVQAASGAVYTDIRLGLVQGTLRNFICMCRDIRMHVIGPYAVHYSRYTVVALLIPDWTHSEPRVNFLQSGGMVKTVAAQSCIFRV